MKKFEVGKRYFIDKGDANFDYENFRLFKVVSRKRKDITLQSDDGGVTEIKTCRVKNHCCGYETVEKIAGDSLDACNECDAEFVKERVKHETRKLEELFADENNEISANVLADNLMRICARFVS